MELHRATQNILHLVTPLNPECSILGAPPTLFTKWRRSGTSFHRRRGRLPRASGVKVEAAVEDQARGSRLCQSRMHQVPVSSRTHLHMKNNFPLAPIYEQWSWWC
ncbi:hypothetical protein M9H77_32230 [Catharanthus roseus]|uniref:Uncharacterized protein n=1 Tax=Catharanthus roseus TaxID=4058 RepID=A0ACC0A6J9_CATRO|nr:hypothetical protein M9H77_32230 [Catharanthus roseus]